MLKTYLAVMAMTLFVVSVPASADIIESFSPSADINVEAQFNSGGGSTAQVVSATVGSGPVNGANSISGDSIFLSIDTSLVSPAATGDYGGGVRASTAATLSSGNAFSPTSSATDYDIVFDMAVNGFQPQNFDLFLRIRDATNTEVVPGQFGINQNTATFAPFFSQLTPAGNVVSVSVGLENFSNVPSGPLDLTDAARFQFTLITRALPGAYTNGTDNVFVLDNLGLTTSAVAVPEPSSLLALGSFAGLALLRRKRRSN